MTIQLQWIKFTNNIHLSWSKVQIQLSIEVLIKDIINTVKIEVLLVYSRSDTDFGYI